MQYVVGALIVVLGIAMVIAGATGSGAGLFTAVTGKAPGSTSSATTDSATTAALAALGGSAGSAGSTGSSVSGNPPPLSSLPGIAA